MTKRVFVFNQYLYRIANHETWQRLVDMDGKEVEVLGAPRITRLLRRTYLSDRHDDEFLLDADELLNRVRADFPDGSRVELLVFNSELMPLPEPAAEKSK